MIKYFELDKEHPAFIQGSEAWSKGAPLTENPYEQWEFAYLIWAAGWMDIKQSWDAEHPEATQ